METHISLISVHFRRLDKKDNILIHWQKKPNGSSEIFKGELVDDDVEVLPEWVDERYSANRCKRLFYIVEKAMTEKYIPIIKKKPQIKIGEGPSGEPIVGDVHISEDTPVGVVRVLAPTVNPFEGLSVKELKGILDLRDAIYPSKATKKELVALITGETLIDAPTKPEAPPED